MRKTLPALLIVAAGVLSACGGSTHVEVEVPAPPVTPSGVLPPTATATIQALVSFIGGLMPSDRDTPLNIDAAVPPTSETAAPLPVN